MKIEEILLILQHKYPDAGCELDYENLYQLAVAVILSAQTTDIAVNKVTPDLFRKYPDVKTLSKAEIVEVEKYIRNIGLYHNKAKNIVGFARQVISDYQGEIPDSRQELMKLPGVGRKTANVILSEYFRIPAIAVDTHVERVSKRLGLARESDSVLQVEAKLQRKIKKVEWSHAHHLLLFFGRYQCKALNPACQDCQFTAFCRYYKKKHLQ